MILPPQGDDRADWLTHRTRTGIHHVPVRWDGLGKPHVPDDCGLSLPYLAVINPRNGDLVTWEEDVEDDLLQWCLMQPAVWMAWSDTSDEGSDEGPDYDEESEEEPGGVWRPPPPSDRRPPPGGGGDKGPGAAGSAVKSLKGQCGGRNRAITN